MQKLTFKQQFAFDYLKKNASQYISPSVIGREYRIAIGTNYYYLTSSDYSSVGSDVCKTLVKKGLAVRNNKGHYKVILRSSSPTATFPAEVSEQAFKPEVEDLNTNKNIESQEDFDQARYLYNKSNGFHFVEKLPNGNEIYKKQQEDGSWIYYGQSGEIYNPIWNSAICTKSELIAIAKDCYKMGYEVIVTGIQKQDEYRFEKGQTIFYMKDNLIHSASILFQTLKDGEAAYETIHGVFKEADCFESKIELIDSL